MSNKILFRAEMGVEQLEALRDIGKAASTEKERITLTGVCFEVTSKGLYVAATDSYMLAFAKLSDAKPRVRKHRRVVVQAKELTAACKLALKEKGNAWLVSVTESDVFIHLREDGARSEPVPALDLNDYQPVGRRAYPNWWDLVKNGEAGKTSFIALCPYRVRKIGEALGCSRNGFDGNYGLQVQLGKRPLDPIVVAPIHSEVPRFGLLMPVRLP